MQNFFLWIFQWLNKKAHIAPSCPAIFHPLINTAYAHLCSALVVILLIFPLFFGVGKFCCRCPGWGNKDPGNTWQSLHETEKKKIQYFSYNKVKWSIHLMCWTWKHIFALPSIISLGKPMLYNRFLMGLGEGWVWGAKSPLQFLNDWNPFLSTFIPNYRSPTGSRTTVNEEFNYPDDSYKILLLCLNILK